MSERVNVDYSLPPPPQKAHFYGHKGHNPHEHWVFWCFYGHIQRSHSVTVTFGPAAGACRGSHSFPPLPQGEIEVSRSQPLWTLGFLVILRSHPTVTYGHSHNQAFRKRAKASSKSASSNPLTDWRLSRRLREPIPNRWRRWPSHRGVIGGFKSEV